MGRSFVDHWQALTQNPAGYLSHVKDKVLQTTGRKRRREEEADGAGPNRHLQSR